MSSTPPPSTAPHLNPFIGILPDPSTANPALRDHTNLFKQWTYPVGDSVWVFVGWNLANIIFAAIDEPADATTGYAGLQGLIVIDTGEDIDQMKQVWASFTSVENTQVPTKFKTFPIIGCVLTHHHADHCNGTTQLLEIVKSQYSDPQEGEDKANNLIIYGADNLDAEYQQENGLISPLMSCRALAQYNGLLARYYPEEVAGLNSGIGPIIHQGQVGYIAPRNLLSTSKGQTIQQLNFGQRNSQFQAVWVPSEANSEVAVYWKEKRVLFSAEVIQDHSFPNLYTLRGAKFRDPSYWAAAIDTFLEKFSDATDVVLQHGPPIIGGNYEGVTICEIWTRYRDAIQYVHDQTLRYALQGYAKDEIMHIVTLPQKQATFSPWLQEFYGTVKHSVPAVYTGYIGWFDGDPIELNATPRSEYAARMIALLGGAEAVLQIAKDVFFNASKPVPGLIQPTQEQIQRDYQWAAELATLVIREDPEYEKKSNPEAIRKDVEDAIVTKGCKHHQHRKEGTKTWWEARFLKAAIFKQFAYTTICANWRGTYLTAAHELEGVSLLSQITNKLRIGCLQPAAAAAMSVDESILELQVRLKAEKAQLLDDPAAGVTVIKLGLQVQNTPPNVPTGYLLFIRNCVLIVQTFSGGGTDAIPGADVTIVADIATINVLLSGNNLGGYDTILRQTPPTEQQKQEFQKIAAEVQAKSGVTPVVHRYPITYVSTLADPASAAVDFFSYCDQGRYIEPPNIYLH